MHQSIHKLIRECADLNIRLDNNLPLNLRFLVWISPTSIRNPELSVLWQPLHDRRKTFAKLFTYSTIIGYSIAYGLYKFLKYRGFYCQQFKNKSPVLLIIPDVIVDEPEEFKTNYLIEDEDYQVDKLLFSYSKKRLKQAPRFSTLNSINKMVLFLKLFTAILNDLVKQLFKRKITWRYLDALLLFSGWILSQSWYFVWDLYHMLNNCGISSCNKYLLSLHEMHSYSKVVWTVANEKGLSGIAVQHALIMPEKLWYFPDKSEIRANYPLPDIFFVCSDETKELLQPLYPKTEFQNSCSPRFSHWKQFFTLKHPVGERVYSKCTQKDKSNRKVILFVNSAAIHDIVVIKAMYKLMQLELNENISLRFRTHPNFGLNFFDQFRPPPHVSLSFSEQFRIKMAVKLRKIEISSKPLREDLDEADLVIGANSTVIQEAALMGVSVMGVCDDDYIASSILPSSSICQVDKLTRDELNQCMIKKQDDFQIQRLKTNIGVFSPNLTTKLIFDLCNIAN